jgi:putative (di)nucleoside polyphosphate hydrolase
MDIKEKGYRLNVGIIVANSDGKLLYCKRKNSTNWQFPQGGIDKNEDIFDAALRELYEEVGIEENKIKLIKESDNWYKYDLPKNIKEIVFYGKVLKAKSKNGFCLG